MITGDEIDIAAKKRLLGRFRAVAKFEADVEPVLLPNSRSVHHLPDRQMRMRAIEAAYLHHRLLSHFYLLMLISSRETAMQRRCIFVSSGAKDLAFGVSLGKISRARLEMTIGTAPLSRRFSSERGGLSSVIPACF